jgi:eukaryotic-like serine/threonine-protein kinase
VNLRKAKITFIAVPWGDVTVDGKSLGPTPLPPRDLFEGTYSVTAKNPDSGKTSTQTIEVQGGVAQTVKFDLR